MIDRSYRLSRDERIKGRARLQKEAIEQVMNIWRSGERSAVLIRPTGFGKTYTVASLLNKRKQDGSFVFKKIAFVYPMNCIMNSLKADIAKINAANIERGMTTIPDDAVTYISYQTLALQSDIPQAKYDEIYGNYDLLVFDEFHCAGADKTSKGCAKLYKAAKRSRALGMTATFNRMDGVNQAIEVFDAHNLTDVYTYTDAVKEGLMPKLAYYDGYMYRMYDAKGNAIKSTDEVAMAETVKLIEKVENDTIVDNTIHNFGDMIRANTIDALGKEAVKHGTRWLCYFSDINAINMKIQEVEVSFKRAFPDKEIKILKVSSEDAESRNNLDLLEQKYDAKGNPIFNEWLNPRDNECIVLMTCNMLNMGYHAGNLTGEILYRKTGSETVYQQQIGRALTIERETEPIIIDMVRALDFVTRARYMGHVTSKSSKKNDEDTPRDTKDANYISGECLEMRTTNKEFEEVAEKLERMRYHDILAELITTILKMPSITVKSIVAYANHYKVRPKYIFGELKYAVGHGECDVMLTNIGTFDGVTKISKEKVHKKLSDEEKDRINKIFKHLAKIQEG